MNLDPVNHQESFLAGILLWVNAIKTRMVSLVNFHQMFQKEITPVLNNLSQKTEEEGMPPNSNPFGNFSFLDCWLMPKLLGIWGPCSPSFTVPQFLC